MSQQINTEINFDRNDLELLANAIDMVVPPSPLPDFDYTRVKTPEFATACGRDSPVDVDNFITSIELDNVDFDNVGNLFGVDDDVQVVCVKKADNPVDENYLNKIRYGPTGIPISEVKVEREKREPDYREWREVAFAKYMQFYDRLESRGGKKLRFIDQPPRMDQRITRTSVVKTTGVRNVIPPSSPVFDSPVHSPNQRCFSTPPQSPPRLTLVTPSAGILKPTPVRSTPIIPMKRSADVDIKYAPVANKKPRIVENKFRCKVEDIVQYVPEIDRKCSALRTPANFATSTIGQMYAKEYKSEVKEIKPKSEPKQCFKVANPEFDVCIQEAGNFLAKCQRMGTFYTKSGTDGQIYKWAPAVNRSGKHMFDGHGNILYISENGFVATWMTYDGKVYTRQMTHDREKNIVRFTFKNAHKKANKLYEYAHKRKIFN